MSDVELKFDSHGLIPAILQAAATGKVLMVAYMNTEALRLTRETGYAHFYSRSRRVIWKKGETSGNTQKVRKILYDCDSDTLLLEVDPNGPACHTGNETCFFTELGKGDTVIQNAPDANDNIVSRIYQVIQQRKAQRPEGSYVAGLFNKGENAILKKIGEESAEFVMACMKKDGKNIAAEAADLWFHSLIAMAEAGVGPEEVFEELKRRFK